MSNTPQVTPAPDATPAITLDMSKAQPLQAAPAITLDMSKAQPLTQAGPPPATTPATPGVLDYVPGARLAEGVLSGVGGAALQTVQGAKNLANKVLPQSMQIPDIPQEYTQNTTVPEKVGGLAENIGEWAGGEELLKGAATLAHLSATPEVLALMEKYPKTARLIQGALATAKGAAIGGAQGAVKGAATNQAVEGAEGGAAGGAIGAGASEAVSGLARPIARLLGIGGLTGEEAMVKAARPSVTEDAAFRRNLQTAAPRIIDAAKTSPIKTVGDFEDLLHDTAQDIRQNEFQPMIDRHANEAVSASPVAANIRKAITSQMKEYSPEEADELEDFAKKFDKPTTLGKAESDLQYFNSKLRDFYKANAVDKAAALKNSGTIAKYEAAADGLRDLTYSNLRRLGEDAPELLQQQYGALKQMERVFSKRATVSDRQAPLNLTQILGATEAAGAVLSGHPAIAAAGAVPFVVKSRQAPAALIRQGVKALASEANPTTSAVGQAAKALAAPAASQVGQAATTEEQIRAGATNPSSGAPVTAAPEIFTPAPADIELFKTWTPTGPTTAPGMTQPGNIDLTKRPLVHHSDGSVSSLYSMSYPYSEFTGNPKDKGEVLVPQVSQDGKILSDAQAREYARKTKQILGVFANPDDADRYADLLHLKQGAFQTYKNGGRYNAQVETHDNWQEPKR